MLSDATYINSISIFIKLKRVLIKLQFSNKINAPNPDSLFGGTSGKVMDFDEAKIFGKQSNVQKFLGECIDEV